ncbi:response regulator transcription factor [Streptomyces sp. V1I1]|uniref:response regulator transcription factor n=1 Tax=Streptomyces sp. V1I1 TaxID=3042272 RepID=UPI0027818010|nr:helix-turn-helix transcriptional regulator [Streptomyces sp. V1I1]MDQ0939903.1 DNA-binding CsgD family transcriptional regulator [Streptomyces sp. V1I1]
MHEPADAVEMRAALLRLRRTTGLPVAFGGLLHDARRLRIAELSGAATGALRGLGICAGNGLGGKSMALSRPCAVTVVVRRKVRGVLYGALREPTAIGDRTFDAAVAAARDVEQALVVRDEVQRLLAAAREPVAGAGAWEEVREAHGELRALAPRIVDQALRETLLSVCGRLATAAGGRPREHTVTLTPRELDVVACVAAGSTNAAAAERLGLKPETVKGYLRSAMRKLGAHTRLEAVVAARRARLLP